MKEYWGSGCMTPHILNLGTRWRRVVSFTPRPLFPRYPFDRTLRGPQNRPGRGGEEKKSQQFLCRELNPDRRTRTLSMMYRELIASFEIGTDGRFHVDTEATLAALTPL